MKYENYRVPLLVAGVGSLVAVTVGTVTAVVVARGRSGDGGGGGADYYSGMPTPKVPLSAEREANKAEIWNLASKLAEEIGWPGLPGFMIAQAWAESRFKRTAQNPEASWNAARGVFQIRPTSAMLGSDDPVEQNPSLLFNLPLSVALNAWYLARLRKWGPPSQLDWLSLRRGTALPKLVDDFNEEAQRSGEVRGRLAKALRAVGLPEKYMSYRAYPDDFSWPGIERVLEILGLDLGQPIITSGEPAVTEPLWSSEGGLTFAELGEEDAA